MRRLVQATVQRVGETQLVAGLKRRLHKGHWWARRRFDRPKLVSRDIGGVTARFAVDDPAGLSYYEFETERPVIETLVSMLTPDDVFYDVGANIGLYTCFAAVRLADSPVVAFEPTTTAYRKLTRNAALNGPNVRTRQVALGDRNGTVELLVDRDDIFARETVIESAGPESRPRSFDRRRTRIRRAEDLVAADELPRPTVLKVDVEGAESHVLSGFGELLSGVRLVLCEVHHHKGRSGERGPPAVELLEECGFETRTLHRRDTVEFVLAERPAVNR